MQHKPLYAAMMTASQLDIQTKHIQPKRMYTVRDRVVNVKIEAARYSNSQTDHEAKDNLANQTGAELHTFNVSKQKLAKKIVSRISKFNSRARDLARVPKSRADGKVKYEPMRFGLAHWDKGTVLVPVERIVDMQAAFNQIESEMKAEMEKMRGEWDQLITETKAEMQGMYDPSVIPSYDEFISSWGMKMTITALPELDPRITLDDMQLNDVINQVKEQTCEVVTGKLAAGWRNAAESLLTSLEYVAAVFDNDRETVEKLNDPDGTQTAKAEALRKAAKKKAEAEGKEYKMRAVQITESLFDNLKNQLATCRSLATLAGDQSLLELCDQVSATLGNTQPKYLSNNPAERRRYATAAKSLVTKAKRTVQQTEQEIDNAVDELAAFA